MKITVNQLKDTIKSIIKEALFPGQHMLVKDLPRGIQLALKEVGYGRKDIKVEPSSTYEPLGPGGAGQKEFTAVVELATDRYKIHWGSWGGANMFNPTNPVDLDTQSYPLPIGGAVVKGSIGGTHPTYAYVLVNPENLQKLLPSGTDETAELSKEEKTALKIMSSYRAGARKDGFSRYDLGSYNPNNPIIQKLVKMGLIKVGNTGIMMTLAGKNLADSLSGIYV
jgi:hypothetical protein